MVYLIKRHRCAYFRWHDSGDLQGIDHLFKIVQIAHAVPDCKFWLPTREYGIVRKYWELFGKVPFNEMVPNLCIRLSATMFDSKPPVDLATKMGCGSSAVSKSRYNCPAYSKTIQVNNGKKTIQKSYCGSCRKCWDVKEQITYKLHGKLKIPKLVVFRQ